LLRFDDESEIVLRELIYDRSNDRHRRIVSVGNAEDDLKAGVILPAE
jgi:hypothetical protein